MKNRPDRSIDERSLILLPQESGAFTNVQHRLIKRRTKIGSVYVIQTVKYDFFFSSKLGVNVAMRF